MEIWKPINGYEGLYEVSNLGRIRSLDRWVQRKGQAPKFMPSIIIKLKGSSGEYQRVNLHKSGRMTTFLVHRLVANAFLSNPRNLAIVNHKDGNKSNNCVDNLEFCSSAENNEHAKRMSLRKENLDGIQKNNAAHSLKLAVYKDSQLLHIASNSREMAVWIKRHFKLTKDKENLSRAIRSHSAKETEYMGLRFVRLNSVESVRETKGFLNILRNDKILTTVETSNEAAVWLKENFGFENTNEKTIARTIRKKVNTNIPYLGFIFIKH